MDSCSGPDAGLLQDRAAALQARITAWPGVRCLDHPLRGRRFCTARGEFLHFHGDHQIDLRLRPADRDRALEREVAHYHPRSHEGGWVIVRVADITDREILRLAAAAYRARRGTIRTFQAPAGAAPDSGL